MTDPLWNDPRTELTNYVVNHILHLHQIMEKIPDAFIDAIAVTKSHIEAANTPARITIPNTRATDTAPTAKRGGPPGSKDSRPRQKKAISTQLSLRFPDPTLVDNEEISIHYMHNGHLRSWNTIEPDEHFAFLISQDISINLPDPRTIKEAQQCTDWPKWDSAINSKLDSLTSIQTDPCRTCQPTSNRIQDYPNMQTQHSRQCGPI